MGVSYLHTHKNIFLMIISLPLLLFIALAGWRVDYIKILDMEKNLIFSSPTALRHTFTTRYIHSVELTPVEDEYRILAGRLWAWEERVRSTNAGLPFDRPKNGRFIESGNWMLFQGGRVSWKEYYYRIGNKHLGLNQVKLAPFGRRNFFELFPGQRLTVAIVRAPFMYSGVYRNSELEKAPMNAPVIDKRDRN